MQDNQNAFQNAGQNGYSFHVAVGNQSATFLVVVLAFILLVALLKSEKRYRKLMGSVCQAAQDRTE